MSRDERIGETVLGKYRIGSVIGSGGMGSVYEAEDLRLGRPVAIKILKTPQNAAAYGDMGRRFRREARTIAQVTHPNLVTLIEFDLLEDGTPAMVMERVNGQSLRELMRSRPFSAVEITEILRQTLSALAACHEAQIVHRDLKPGNILLEEKGEELHVKIIDFGLTKLIATDSSVLTQAGEVFGSPRFMAPEQWMGKEVDGRTDLYALGIIGFCLLQGHHFIEQGNPVEVCRAHIQQPRPNPTTDLHGRPVPQELIQALLKATMPKIDQRFASAADMRQAITGQSPILRSSGAMPVALIAPPTEAPRFPTALDAGPQGPPDDGKTMVDPDLAAKVLRATGGTPDDSESSAGLPVSPQSVVMRATAASTPMGDNRDNRDGNDTAPVPHEVRNALQVIDRADVEAALRATDENPRPARRPSAVMAQVASTPAIDRTVATEPASDVVEYAPREGTPPDQLVLPTWAYIVAGLVAAAAAALMVLLLK